MPNRAHYRNQVLKEIGVQRWARKQAVVPVSPTGFDNDVSEMPVAETTLDNAVQSPSSAIDTIALESWQGLQTKVRAGAYCESCQTLGALSGQGTQSAQWMCVVDAPSGRDVRENRHLVGRSGELLDAILSAIGESYETVYLTSLFKCPPSREGVMTHPQCDCILEQEIALVKPRILLVFGEFAAQHLLKSNEEIDALAGHVHSLNEQTQVVVSDSLADMLKQPALKRRLWQALKQCL